MRRQKKVDRACERCRQKRTKCDGTQPCHRCQVADEECEFSVIKSASKDQLRAEIQRLKNTIIAKESASASEESESTKIKDDEGNSPGTSRTSVGPSWPWYQLNEAAIQSSFNLSLSWRQCRTIIGLPAMKRKRLSVLSLPPMPLVIFDADATLDMWTNIGWTKAHVRHLFDAIITWDYLPLSLLRIDAFLKDYDGDSHRFCSSALVHSVLALSMLIINGNEDHLETLPSGWFGSQKFHDATKRCLDVDESSFSLPDVQALGIMSLYQLHHGEESEALDTAQAFLHYTTKLCEQDIPLEYQTDDMYATIRDTTKCGAVSLARLLSLTTGQLFNMQSSSEQENELNFDEYLLNMDKLMMSRSPIRTAFLGVGESYDAQMVATKLFQLIQWVHTSIILALTSPQGDGSNIKGVYMKCLAWYSDIFSLLSTTSSKTPFILFTKICYHFSLLCVFRPFVITGIPHSELNPVELCSQAAQSILSLVQSYDDLFTLQRVSSLVPYFVLASGLFGQTMEDNGSEIEPKYLLLRDQVRAMKQVQAGEQEFLPNRQRSPNSPYVQVSMVNHARFLLAKMGSTHPGAKTAESKLAVG